MSQINPIMLYSNNHKTTIPVTITLLSSIHDQPERRDILGLSAGNSKFHARFGYSMDFEYLYNTIKACEDCYKSIDNELNSDKQSYKNNYCWRSNNCKKCVCWKYVEKSPL